MKKVTLTLNENELELLIGTMVESVSSNNSVDYIKELGFSEDDIEKLMSREENRASSLDYSKRELNKESDSLVKKLIEKFLS